MQIFVNLSANSGEGKARWNKIERELSRRQIEYRAHFPACEDHCLELVKLAIKDKETCIISAGGDGTLNAILNVVMDQNLDRPYEGVLLGGIGLGSSNDFHKPRSDFPTIESIPVRIDTEDTSLIDVGKIQYVDVDQRSHVRYFVLNASIGFKAEGNASFHSGNKILDWLNSCSNDIAIVYSILINLLTFKRFRVSIGLDHSQPKDYIVTSLDILKKIHVAGDLRYDTPVKVDDGYFDVNLLEDAGKIRLIKTIIALYRGRFSGLPNTRCWRAKSLEITPEKPVYLEFDGEVVPVQSATFTVLPKVLRVCN